MDTLPTPSLTERELGLHVEEAVREAFELRELTRGFSELETLEWIV